MAGEQRVMVVRPEDDPAAGGDRLDVVGRRPASPSVGVPAVPVDPRVGVRERRVRRPDRRHPVGERRDRREVDLPERVRGLGEVEVGVGEARDRHLVRFQVEPSRERVGAGLQRHLGAGEGDPPVADADGLDPAEPAGAAERGDTAGDQRVEGHALSRGRRESAGVGASPAVGGAAGAAGRA